MFSVSSWFRYVHSRTHDLSLSFSHPFYANLLHLTLLFLCFAVPQLSLLVSHFSDLQFSFVFLVFCNEYIIVHFSMIKRL